MDMKELAQMIETQWMTYNAAVINRLHPQVEKQTLANIMINNATDIVAALRAYNPETDTVITGDKDEPPRKTRKKDT